MTTTKTILSPAAIALALVLLRAPSAALTAKTISVKQGNTVVISAATEPLSAEFGSNTLPTFAYKNSYRVVAGIPATKAPGRYPLTVELKNGVLLAYTVIVKARNFPLVNLGIPSKLGLTPQALTAALETQNSDLNANVFSSTTPRTYFTAPFGLPLRNNRDVASAFGEIRKTGNQEIRHMGIDFGAPKGASVVAINAGRVVKAYNDPVYGNSVIVDHGEGIFSFYLHLDKIIAQEGTLVRKGQFIGTVGDTGYASAPHLHLSIKINGVSVDPLNFVNNFK